MTILLIDDWREFNEADAIAKTDEEGLEKLAERNWDELWIDYSLGMFQKNGLGILKEAHVKKQLPNKIHIVSSHPSGIRAMENWLESVRYRKEGEYWIKTSNPAKRRFTVYVDK